MRELLENVAIKLLKKRFVVYTRKPNFSGHLELSDHFEF
jgi:hypothetical protein